MKIETEYDEGLQVTTGFSRDLQQRVHITVYDGPTHERLATATLSQEQVRSLRKALKKAAGL